MPIFLQDGKILVINGEIAVHENCCCLSWLYRKCENVYRQRTYKYEKCVRGSGESETIYVAFDFGDVAIIDGVCYKKYSTHTYPMDVNKSPAGVTSYPYGAWGGFKYDNSDNEVTPAYSFEYNACANAIMNLPENSGTSELTVQSAGVVRYTFRSTWSNTIYINVNGDAKDSINRNNTLSWSDSHALQVNSGDHITISGGGANYGIRFIPDNY